MLPRKVINYESNITSLYLCQTESKLQYINCLGETPRVTQRCPLDDQTTWTQSTVSTDYIMRLEYMTSPRSPDAIYDITNWLAQMLVEHSLCLLEVVWLSKVMSRRCHLQGLCTLQTCLHSACTTIAYSIHGSYTLSTLWGRGLLMRSWIYLGTFYMTLHMITLTSPAPLWWCNTKPGW